MPAPDQVRIFVSHSHQDNAYCRDYVQHLRALGCDVWYDEHNLGWGALRATIEREMPQREHFVAIFSQSAVASEWVNAEIDAALELLRDGTLRTLTFVRAESCTIPLLLRRWKRIEHPGGAPVGAEEAARRTFAIVAPAPDASATAIAATETVTSSTSVSYTRTNEQLYVPITAESRKPSIPPERFPPQLSRLGYEAHARDGVEWIIPPVCLVPAGQFRLGSDKRHDPQARDNELNRRVVTLPAFEIARFPVTVAEYACFLAATQRKKPVGRIISLTWEQQLQKLDHPVVNVSWYDAFDYAVWLAERTGQPWRLPTEAEWEKAARGDPRDPLGASSERIYPWGDRFDQARCNTDKSGQRATTPVGWYGPDNPDPRAGRQSGASPCRAEELAGNVWEWQATAYAADYSKSETVEPRDSTQNRCLRGGSWNDDAESARAARRYNYPPDYGYSKFGFRLVRASPGSFH